MKKKLLGLTLAILMTFCGLVLSNCGEGSVDAAYSQLEATVSTINSDSVTFIGGNQTESGANYHFRKVENDSASQIFAIPMKYINNFVVSNNGSEELKGFNLGQDYINMAESYTKLLRQQEYLSILSPQEPTYNGALTDLRARATELTDATFAVAFRLAKIEKPDLETLKTSQINAQSALKLKNYLCLKIGYDYYKLLLESANSSILDAIPYEGAELTQLINTARSGLTSFTNNLFSKNSTSMNLNKLNNSVESEGELVFNNDSITKLFDNESLLDKERENLNISFSNLSIYKLYKNYDGNIADYEDSERAIQYFEEITDYFTRILPNNINYYISILI